MLFSLLSLVGLALACSDKDSAHVHDAHEKRDFPLTPPYRPLTWADFNVIHTTDTHGWLLGHQRPSWPEPNYTGDLGDFASFVAHMKQIAIEKDVDLLLVDSGDIHDGTGLSDGYPPGGVDAHESNKFLERLPYDLMTVGNHELYAYVDTYDMYVDETQTPTSLTIQLFFPPGGDGFSYTNFVPHLHGRYLTSNVNITVFNSDGEAVSVPIGKRYRKFTTRKGRKVTSLGVIFDFTGNAANTTVQNVADMVKEQWFTEAIADEPDVFLLIGHMPVSYDNWPVVFQAIRAVHPYTPIMVFGGHTHIRDCQQYDGRSMAMESGRYMETIGWMSANLEAGAGNTNNISFSRRYLDQNRVTYQYHTATSSLTFDTSEGNSITRGLQKLAADFDLAHFYGTAPHDYTLDMNSYPSNDSVLTLFIAEAAPVALAINNTRADVPNIIISDADELRYGVFKGPFTKNDQLTAAPYTDSFLYIPNVRASVSKQVLPALNKKSSFKRSAVQEVLWNQGRVEGRYRTWLEEMYKQPVEYMIDTSELTLGYVTTDGCPGAGDDTLHIKVPYYNSPNYISSNAPDVADDTFIDLVFIDFVEKHVLSILNSLQSETTYTPSDVSLYSPTLANEVLGLYAQAKWN